MATFTAAVRQRHIPEHRRTTRRRIVAQLELADPLLDLHRLAARLAQAGKVTFHVGEKHRHATGTESLGEHLQGDGLAGARGPGDQPVAISHLGQQQQVA